MYSIRAPQRYWHTSLIPMGINGWYPFIKEHENTNGACKPVKMENLAGKRIVFDGNAFVYLYRFGNKEFSHILQYGWLVADLMKIESRPIVVFDGEHPEEKDEENELRRKTKEQFVQTIKQTQENIKRMKTESGFDPERPIDLNPSSSLNSEMLSNYQVIQKMEDDLEKHYNGKVIVLPEHIEEVKEILRAIGVWVIEAPKEGEAVCALLNRLGEADLIAGDDADIFGFGGRHLIRGLGWRGKRRDEKLQYFNISKILGQIDLTYDELVEVFIMCENDFNKTSRIQGFGPAKSYKVIKEHGTVENYVEFKLKEQEERIKKDKKKAVKRKREPKLFTVPDRFNPQKIRDIFHEYGKPKSIPESLLKEKSNFFDMKRALTFFIKKKMDFYVKDLREWALFIEGKDYSDEEIQTMIEEITQELLEEDSLNKKFKQDQEDLEESFILNAQVETLEENDKVFIDDEVL